MENRLPANRPFINVMSIIRLPPPPLITPTGSFRPLLSLPLSLSLSLSLNTHTHTPFTRLSTLISSNRTQCSISPLTLILNVTVERQKLERLRVLTTLSGNCCDIRTVGILGWKRKAWTWSRGGESLLSLRPGEWREPARSFEGNDSIIAKTSIIYGSVSSKVVYWTPSCHSVWHCLTSAHCSLQQA